VLRNGTNVTAFAHHYPYRYTKMGRTATTTTATANNNTTTTINNTKRNKNTMTNMSIKSLSPSASSAPLFRSNTTTTTTNTSHPSLSLQASPAVETTPATTTDSDSDGANGYELSTLTTWLLREEMSGSIDQELGIVLSSIAVACKQIASLVNRAGISNLTGLAGAENIQGEDQKKLDVVSNDVFCNCLRSCGRTGVIASEEEDVPVAVEETYSGNYIVVFDPLDGSSNIDAGISTGSIFGIYEPIEGCSVDGKASGLNAEEVLDNCILNVCQPGSRLIASGYCMYSSSTVFVLTVGKGVYGFTLDPSIGEFVLTHPKITIPDSGTIYSFNEGNYASWEKGLQEYMTAIKSPPDGSKCYSARYIGSLVGDFHRTMLYGGIYGYPGDSKNTSGKLRLLYECAPMSMIAEQAGGKGSTGSERMLDVCPEQVHQRVPFFVGSKKEVELAESYLAGKGWNK